MAIDELRQNDMMAHLLDALDRGEDIGHYGRLVFTMVARYFLGRDEVIEYLQKDPGFSHDEAVAMYQEVKSHDYSPPRQEQVLEWQDQQDFPICQNPMDPNGCNVYEDLKFPDDVYQHISQYYRKMAAAEERVDSFPGALHRTLPEVDLKAESCLEGRVRQRPWLSPSPPQPRDPRTWRCRSCSCRGRHTTPLYRTRPRQATRPTPPGG